MTTEILFAFSIFCLVLGGILLLRLSYIDIRLRILPNPLVAMFALTGLLLHILNGFQIIPIIHVISGCCIGFFSLYIIRKIGNKIYHRDDTLGLGDVKLMAAAGIWLGTDAILLALTLGAAVSIFLGVFEAMRLKRSPLDLSLPAGPGFAVGILIAGVWTFGPYFGL